MAPQGSPGSYKQMSSLVNQGKKAKKAGKKVQSKLSLREKIKATRKSLAGVLMKKDKYPNMSKMNSKKHNSKSHNSKY